MKRESGYLFEEKVMQEQKCKAILPFDIRRVDEDSYYYFNISGKLSLYEYFQDKKKSVDDYKNIYGKIFEAVEELEEYLLPAEGILLNSKNVFYDEKTDKIYFCYLPAIKNDLMKQLLDMTEELLEIINYEDRKLVEYLYDAHEIISRGQLPECEIIDNQQEEILLTMDEEEEVLDIEEEPTFYKENVEMEHSGKFYTEILISVSISLIVMFLTGYQLFDIYQHGWRLQKWKILVTLFIAAVCNFIYLVQKVRLKTRKENAMTVLTDKESIDKIGEI